MSSSQQSSNNDYSTRSSAYVDYETNESSQAQRPSQQEIPENRNPISENDTFEQMDPFQEYGDEDLSDDLVEQSQSNNKDDDESVFSDVVQDAFKKYQNEFSKYWTYDDTIWDNKFTNEELFDDNEQDELYAQMEECWNYMYQETSPIDSEQPSVDHSQISQLNPDAIEFKPSWLQTTSSSINSSEERNH